MNNLFLLLVLYQLKHFICDYPLQGKYMLGKFKGGYDWILPLSAHCLLHGLFTLIIALIFNPHVALVVTALDMFIHFCMDRIKASPDLLGRFKSLSADEFKTQLYQRQKSESFMDAEHLDDESRKVHRQNVKNIDNKFKRNTYFWWSLGLDQMVHHLTHYLIIWMILK